MAYIALGNTLTFMDKIEDALGYYREASRLDPNNDEIHLIYAEAIEEYISKTDRINKTGG